MPCVDGEVRAVQGTELGKQGGIQGDGAEVPKRGRSEGEPGEEPGTDQTMGVVGCVAFHGQTPKSDPIFCVGGRIKK